MGLMQPCMGNDKVYGEQWKRTSRWIRNQEMEEEITQEDTSSLGMEGFRGKGKLHIVVLGPDTDDPVLLQLWKDFTEVDPYKIEDDLIREVMTGLKKDGEEMAEMSEFIQNTNSSCFRP